MGRYEATEKQWIALDAVSRAVRTWWVSIAGLVAVSAGDLLVQLLVDGDVLSGDFWRAVIKGVIGAVLAATASYWLRLRKPPATEDIRPAERTVATTVFITDPALADPGAGPAAPRPPGASGGSFGGS